MNGRKTIFGFTLLEMLVVIVIVGVISAISFAAVRRSQAAAAAETFISLQVREMAVFSKAAQEFASENKASWNPLQRYEITAAQLVTAGKLPSTFAVRGGASGASPIGELYRAFAIKDATGTVRLVIADFGRAPTDALVRRAGYQVNANSLQGYKARVADELLKSSGGFSGYVAGGLMLARGPSGSFTQDLAAYFSNSAPALPVAVELVGWPEYVRPGGAGPGGGGGPQMTCNVLPAGKCVQWRGGAWVELGCFDNPGFFGPATHYRGPVIPAGATNVTTVPLCGAEGFGIISPGVPGVALTFGQHELWGHFQSVKPITCTVGPLLPGQQGFWDGVTKERFTTVRINDGEVFRAVCSTSVDTYDDSTCSVVRGGGQVRSEFERILQVGAVTIPATPWAGSYTLPALQNIPGTPYQQPPRSRGATFFCTPAS